MRALRLALTLSVVVVGLLTSSVLIERPGAAPAPTFPHIARYMKPGLPLELVSARKVDRIAWIAYEEGKRNVFTAAAPGFAVVRVTSFLKDDGTDLTTLRISDDGSTVIFVRGHNANSAGWVANPTGDPDGAERAIWAARVATPGVAWRLAEGSSPEVSPDGRSVLYVKDGQIYRARVSQTSAVTKADKGEKPFIVSWGRNSGPRWSPDGTKVAFSTNRVTHSFIGLYDVRTHTVRYVSPSVDRDTSPTWSADGKRLAFLRRPGLPFGQQPAPGRGSGMPEEPAGRQGGGGGGAAAAATGRAGAPPATGAAIGRQSGPSAFSPASQGTAAQGTAGQGTFASAAQQSQAAQAARGSATPAVRTQTPTGTVTAPPAAQAAQAGRQGGGGRGRGGAGNPPVPADAPLAQQPGLYRGLLPGGHTLALMIADAATGEAKEVWHPGPNDGALNNINTIQWANDVVIFSQPAQGNEESPRYHSLNLSGTSPAVRLNSTDGIVEDATAWSLSKDGKTFFYCTNTGDIDRRHIWSVPTAGGTPKQITFGEGLENVPVALASGKQIAVLSSDARRPLSVALWPSDGSRASAGQSAQKVLYPSLTGFPLAEHVVPTNVTLKAEDGVEFHNQLFLPKDIKPGEKRPALIFVHGGPARQMLLGYHYLSFYHVFYGVNQWLTAQGYVVLSVNFRSGIGYGRAFRQAPETGGRGNSEYRDVLAAGKWLAARQDVDPNRVGIWGLSYGGLLTAQALARNSDIFKAGIDLAGVHVQGGSLDPSTVSYQSSSISAIDKWKSPVLLIHGDDDRNVNFAHTVGLVQLLRARNVYHELIVFPDDIHETLLHSRWMYTFDRMEAFLNKFLMGETTAGQRGR